MQETSATYKRLLAAGAPKVVQTIIAGVTYGPARIESATIRSAMLLPDTLIGNCIAKELHLRLRDAGSGFNIPRMASIQMRYRLQNPDVVSDYSEWIPKGVYFVDTRDEGNGVLSIDAFDPMLKTNVSFTGSGDQGFWPRSDVTIVAQVASRIGVTVDERTYAILTRGYQIQYPGYGNGAYTMREMLSQIGIAYGGNWIITDQNQLRLIILGDIPSDQSNYLVTQTGDYIVIGGYRILVSR